MITTREINVNLNKGKLKLRHVSTKNINAGVRVEPPKEPIKPRGITTTILPDVADIAEKKRRDDIMAERKPIEKPVITTGKYEIEIKKKPWKEMTDEEKKVEYKERAKRAATTRAIKKERR